MKGCMAYGVPWHALLNAHPLLEVLCGVGGTRGLVTKVYGYMLQKMYFPLLLDAIWRADFPDLEPDFDWDVVWANVRQSSRCPDHQQIHLNFIHRIYVTPRKLHIMKVKADPKCTLCPVGAIGTFYHMVWECPGVVRFWELVADKLSAMLQVTVPLAPSVLILNELSQLSLQKFQERVFLSGLTAAKKMVATRWKPPHTLTLRQWVLSFLDVVYLKLSMACIYGAKEGTIRLWTQAVEDLKDLLD